MRRLPLPNIISLLLIALLGANYFGCLTDLDWSWQVRTGQRIVESGSLRTTDTFSYTIDGKLLHDFEWLWEVLLWETWHWLGLGGLKLLRVLFVAAPLVLLGWRLHCDGLRWHVVFLALVSAFFVVSPSWNLRPLYCTTIGLFLCWSFLHDLCSTSEANKTRSSAWWGLPLTMLLWANMHPGVITGQALLLGAIGWEWLNFLLWHTFPTCIGNRAHVGNVRHESRWNPPLDVSALRRLTIIAGVAFALTFVSPNPIDRVLYAFSPELKHPIFRIFVEMQPLHRFLCQQPYVAPVVYAVTALVLVSIVKRFGNYRMWELALLGGVALLGSVAVRSLMDWYVIMLAVSLPHVKSMYVEAVQRRPVKAWLHGLLRLDNGLKRMFTARAFRWQLGWPLAAIGALAVLTVIWPGREPPLRDAPEWPVAALDHIERNGLRGNFFAPPDYGAYISWRLKDEAKVYMDTRGFFFPPMLVEDSHYVPSLGPEWRERLQRVLDDYPTDYFLLETWGGRGALWNALAPHITDPIYQDAKTVLLAAAQVRHGLARLDLDAVAASPLALNSD